MSLDKNLFTLSFTPSPADSSVVDLIDPTGVTHYTSKRISNTPYELQLYDPISRALLVTATAPSSTNKTRTLTLHNPATEVSLKHVGMLSWKWAFDWGEHEFEWRKSECYLQRKPDPPVLVAVTKDTPGRLQVKTTQILDYNLNRFDIDDRKGLEIVILTALLTFQDYNEGYRLSSSSGAVAPAPVVPPKPKLKVGIERLREIQLCTEEYNEILIESEGTVEDYGQLCFEILQDDTLLFITLRSASVDEVQKVLLVAEETKRIRHKTGLYEGRDLQQYVLYNTSTRSPMGPTRIDLNDHSKPSDKYAPPQSLSVHLSKIPMPELQPRKTDKGKGKEPKGKDTKEKKQDVKESKGKGKLKSNRSPPSPGSKPEVNKLTRPQSSQLFVPQPAIPGNMELSNSFHGPPLATPPPPPSVSSLNQLVAVSALLNKGMESLRRR